MQTLFPFQILLVNKLQAALYPVPEEQGADNWNLPDAGCRQAQSDVVGAGTIVESEVTNLLSPLLEELNTCTKKILGDELSG